MTPLVDSGTPWSNTTAQHTRAHPAIAAGLWWQAHLQPAAAAVEFTRWALWGGLAGFALMMVLDTTLG